MKCVLEVTAADQLLPRLPDALMGKASLAPLAAGQTPPDALLLDEPIDDDIAVVVTTSGSTGTPKGVELSAAALLVSAEATRKALGSFTWTCVLPTSYVAGLMVLVRGLADREHGGGGVRFASKDLSDLAPDPNFPNAISIVPTQLERAIRDARVAETLARYDQVLVGGAALRAQTLEAAADLGITVTRTYGMSETCGGMVYDGRPLPGVEVLIDEGRVRLKTPSAFSRYRGLPELTAQVLEGNIVTTNDRGRFVDGQLELLGRFDDVVISGGVNVDLAAAQAVVDELSAQPAVLFGVPDDEWGTKILIADEAARPIEWWRQELSGRLQKAALPKQVLAGALPRTSSGKVDFAALRERAN